MTFMHRYLLLAAALALGGCRIFTFGAPSEYQNLQLAEEYSRMEKYDEAIAAYRAHMRYRLSLRDRPEWENPYLYLLMIGDLQLRQHKHEDAQASYELAEKNKVDPALVSDRYRYLASWFEKQGYYDTALSILSLYRSRDELLFDVMRDRIAKEIVERERNSALEPTTPSPIPTPAP